MLEINITLPSQIASLDFTQPRGFNRLASVSIAPLEAKVKSKAPDVATNPALALDAVSPPFAFLVALAHLCYNVKALDSSSPRL